MTKHVFVYGTLLQGESNHPLLSKCKDTRVDALVKGKLYDLGSFPGLKDAGGIEDDNSLVTGEVYTVDSKTLEALDRLEGYNDEFHREHNLYNRVTVPCFTVTGQFLQSVDVYEYNRSVKDDELIKGGSWKHRANSAHLTEFLEPEYLDDDDDLEDLDD